MTDQRTTIVTYESVANAAAKLAAVSQKPSVRLVIAALGGGSPNTVLPLLTRWKQETELPQSPVVSIDPRIASILSEQIAAAIREATRAAEERASESQADALAVAEVGRIAEGQIGQLSLDLSATLARNQQLTGRIESMTIEVERLKEEAGTAVTAARAETLNEREAADTARKALARAELRLESLPSLENKLTELRAELDTERGARIQAELSAAVAVADKASADKQAEELRSRLALADQREQQLRAESAQRQTIHEQAFGKIADSLGAMLLTQQKIAIETKQSA